MNALHVGADPSAARSCVYCLDNGHLADSQIIEELTESYLCVPQGQLVEGFLAAVSRSCVGAMALLPESTLAELRSHQATILEFYARTYGVERLVFYEQGRGGGGAVFDEALGFPHHAHLCALPARVDVHPLLASRFRPIAVGGIEEVPEAASMRPYVYVEEVDADGNGSTAVYVERWADQRRELATFRLKPMIAEVIGRPGAGHWRSHPGTEEVYRVIRAYAAHRLEGGGRSRGGGSDERS